MGSRALEEELEVVDFEKEVEAEEGEDWRS